LWGQHNESMMALLGTIFGGGCVPRRCIWGGVGGGSTGVGCTVPHSGRDMGTRVRSNKERRGDEYKEAALGRRVNNPVGGGCLQLPTLQVRYQGNVMGVVTTVHVERQACSVGGLLSLFTLNRSFEALVRLLTKRKKSRTSSSGSARTTVCGSNLAKTSCVPLKTLKGLLVCGRLCGRSATTKQLLGRSKWYISCRETWKAMSIWGVGSLHWM